MVEIVKNVIATNRHKRDVRRWRNILDSLSQEKDIAVIKGVRSRANELRGILRRVDYRIDHLTKRPLIHSNNFDISRNARWKYRPSEFRRPFVHKGFIKLRDTDVIDSDCSFFITSNADQVLLRQERNNRREDLNPFGIVCDFFDYRGDFASLIISLGSDFVEKTNLTDIISVNMVLNSVVSSNIYMRLKIGSGANTHELLQHFPHDASKHQFDFELDEISFSKNKINSLIVEIILENPRYNAFNVRDITISAHKKALL